jgi:hypothetical protein
MEMAAAAAAVSHSCACIGMACLRHCVHGASVGGGGGGGAIALPSLPAEGGEDGGGGSRRSADEVVVAGESIWDYVERHRARFLNPFWAAGQDDMGEDGLRLRVLRPRSSADAVVLWESLHLWVPSRVSAYE